jgi:glucose-1-phosphate cytidylyltransferase
MKTVILAGGYGTRISEETGIRPKPMVEIGSMPILWHIMKMYSAQGFNDFIICCGYKGYMIKDFFANYHMRKANVSFDLAKGEYKILNNEVEPWKVTLIDTGENTMTGGRIKRIQEYVGNERFFLTYGDGVSDVDFNRLLNFHIGQKVYATLTAVQPPGRFGAFNLEPGSDIITSFREKPKKIKRYGSVNRWKILQISISLQLTGIPDTGKIWIPSAIKMCLRKSGKASRLPGKNGKLTY